MTLVVDTLLPATVTDTKLLRLGRYSRLDTAELLVAVTVIAVAGRHSLTELKCMVGL